MNRNDFLNGNGVTMRVRRVSSFNVRRVNLEAIRLMVALQSASPGGSMRLVQTALEPWEFENQSAIVEQVYTHARDYMQDGDGARFKERFCRVVSEAVNKDLLLTGRIPARRHVVSIAADEGVLSLGAVIELLQSLQGEAHE